MTVAPGFDHIYNCDRFDFCQDTKERRPSENLGQVLFGERIESSPYKVGNISIYTAFLLKMHTQHMHFAQWIVIIMRFFFLSPSSNSIKTWNARKCAQKPTKKEPGRIWPNWIFLRWECSLITSTTGWYLISGFTVKISWCLNNLCWCCCAVCLLTLDDLF